MIQVFRPRYEVEECLREIREVLESGWAGTGPKCKKLEQQWEEFTGNPSLFLNSATAGLHLAVRCLDLPKGSKVATTPITFASTNAVIVYEGLVPHFCDIDPETMAISEQSLFHARDEKVDAVMWVHYAGNISPQFEANVSSIGIPVIEDCAHAAGAFYSYGQRVGSRKDTISVFSFQAVKNMPTFDSGMICSGHGEFDMLRARKLSWLGIDKSTFERSSANDGLYKWKYIVDELGWKYNGNDIAAAIGLVQMKYLDRDNAYRRQVYRWYRDNLRGSKVRLLPHADGSSVHFCAIEVNNRDELLGELKLNDIAPGVHYLPNFLFPAFSKYYKPGQCPNAERMAERVLTLPTHLMLTKSDVDKISEIVIKNAV